MYIFINQYKHIGSYLGKRYIKISRPLVPRVQQQAAAEVGTVTRPAGCRTVFVKNLPYDTNEEVRFMRTLSINLYDCQYLYTHYLYIYRR